MPRWKCTRYLQAQPFLKWTLILRTVLKRVVRATITLLVFGAITQSAHAVDIEETIWGFDGRIVPHRFNPVSLLGQQHDRRTRGDQAGVATNRWFYPIVWARRCRKRYSCHPFPVVGFSFIPTSPMRTWNGSPRGACLPSQRKDLTRAECWRSGTRCLGRSSRTTRAAAGQSEILSRGAVSSVRISDEYFGGRLFWTIILAGKNHVG